MFSAAITALVLLTAGSTGFPAPFDRSGIATIDLIPAELMNGPEVPDLEMVAALGTYYALAARPAAVIQT
ncbi:MAG: hypothetical protein HC822_14680 [Oscillochloris sp.]|nr:hypothetical protein [Oscillochloris sp.]